MLARTPAASAGDAPDVGDRVSDSDLVFAREHGTMLQPEGASRRFGQCPLSLDSPVIGFAYLRHTSASLALAAEWP